MFVSRSTKLKNRDSCLNLNFKNVWKIVTLISKLKDTPWRYVSMFLLQLHKDFWYIDRNINFKLVIVTVVKCQYGVATRWNTEITEEILWLIISFSLTTCHRCFMFTVSIDSIYGQNPMGFYYWLNNALCIFSFIISKQ